MKMHLVPFIRYNEPSLAGLKVGKQLFTAHPNGLLAAAPDVAFLSIIYDSGFVNGLKIYLWYSVLIAY